MRTEELTDEIGVRRGKGRAGRGKGNVSSFRNKEN